MRERPYRAKIGDLSLYEHRLVDPPWFCLPAGKPPKLENPTRAAAVFVNDAADIAVLGSATGRHNHREGSRCILWSFLNFIRGRPALAIADPPARCKDHKEPCEVQLLSLDGGWFRGEVWWLGRILFIRDFAEPLIQGMSGAPILDSEGRAIGVVTRVGGIDGEGACITSSIPDNYW